MPTEQPEGNIRDLKDFKDIQRACDGKRSEAEWTLHYAGMKGEWGSGERGSPVGSRTTAADSAKMVPKMKPHFT